MENEIVLDLLNRMQALENAQNIEWITITISLVALTLSTLSFKKEQASVKDNMLSNIKVNIDNAKTQYETHAMEIASLISKNEKNDEEFRIKQKICNSAFERVLNAYEDGCDAFYFSRVNKKHFMVKYHRDIIGYVEDFPDKFNGTLTHYGSILRYYKEYHMRNL